MADKEEKVEKTEKPQEPAATKPEAASEEKKRKKISRMTLAEVEAQLKTAKEKMGAFQSSFAQHLLARKKELTKS